MNEQNYTWLCGFAFHNHLKAFRVAMVKVIALIFKKISLYNNLLLIFNFQWGYKNVMEDNE